MPRATVGGGTNVEPPIKTARRKRGKPRLGLRRPEAGCSRLKVGHLHTPRQACSINIISRSGRWGRNRVRLPRPNVNSLAGRPRAYFL